MHACLFFWPTHANPRPFVWSEKNSETCHYCCTRLLRNKGSNEPMIANTMNKTSDSIIHHLKPQEAVISYFETTFNRMQRFFSGDDEMRDSNA